MGRMKITCEQAGRICTKNQYKAASLKELIKLNWHFMSCKFCRLFTKQNMELSNMCTSMKSNKTVAKTSLTHEDKENLKAQIKDLNNK